MLLDMAQSCKLFWRDLRNHPAAAKHKDVLCNPGYDLVWYTEKHPVCWGGGDPDKHTRLNRDGDGVVQKQS